MTVYRALGRQDEIEINWWNRPFLVLVISGGLLLAGFILRKTSWENRLTLTIVGCLAFALGSLNDHSEALQFLSAASLSLIAVAGIWIVGLFLGADAPTETDSSHTSGSSADNVERKPESPNDTGPKEIEVEKAEVQQPEPERTGMVAGPGEPPMSAGTVSPAPGVVEWMNDIMGGKA